MPDAKPRFFVLSGPDLGRSFELGEGAVFGRAPECEVSLRAPSISRRHARLEREGAGWALADLGSRNGLSVDGARVERAELRDGLVFQLGDVELRVRLEAPAESPAVVVPPPAPEPPPPPKPEPRVEFTTPGGEALELDEIVLEDVAEPPPAPARPAGAPPRAATGAPPPAAGPPPAERRAAPRASAPLPRGGVELRDAGRPVLQYNRQAARPGFAAADLAQQPVWIKLLVGVLVLALFVALFLVAFRGTLFVRGKVAGAPAVEESAE